MTLYCERKFSTANICVEGGVSSYYACSSRPHKDNKDNKEPLNFKVGEFRLSSLKNRKKNNRMKKKEEILKDHQTYRQACNRCLKREEKGAESIFEEVTGVKKCYLTN